VTHGSILHAFVHFTIEEKGKEARDEGDVSKNLSGMISIGTVVEAFAAWTHSKIRMWPSECDTGFNAAVIVDCR
jgi:hypothetical protein